MTVRGAGWRGVLSGGIALAAVPGSAQAQTLLSRSVLEPGVFFSYTFGAHGGPGFGVRLGSMTLDRDVLLGHRSLRGVGPLFQYELLFRGDGLRHQLVAAAHGRVEPEAGGPQPAIAGELGALVGLGAGGFAPGLHVQGGGSLGWVGLGLRGILIAGRPLRRGDAHVLPAVLSVDGVAAPAGGAWRLAPQMRERLRDRWLAASRAEDASIPTFLQLADDLAAAGAPRTLRDACDHAARDEARHSELCFAVASAYGERSYVAAAPASGPTTGHRRADHDAELARLAAEAFVDGSLGEGAAAAVAAAAAELAGEDAIREVLSVIAADERRHAALAWQVLDWCLSTRRSPVRAALRDLLERVDPEPTFSGAGEDPLERHGLLGTEREVEIARSIREAARDRLAALL